MSAGHTAAAGIVLVPPEARMGPVPASPACSGTAGISSQLSQHKAFSRKAVFLRGSLQLQAVLRRAEPSLTTNENIACLPNPPEEKQMKVDFPTNVDLSFCYSAHSYYRTGNIIIP